MSEGTCARCGAGFVDHSHAQNKRFCSGNCRKRACADAKRGLCADCGTSMHEGSAWSHGERPNLRCQACENKRKAAEHHEMAEQVVTWWNEGVAGREIARRLGWSETSEPGVLFTRLRAEGYDLPYRYRTGRKNATAFPHLQRAA